MVSTFMTSNSYTMEIHSVVNLIILMYYVKYYRYLFMQIWSNLKKVYNRRDCFRIACLF